MPPDSDEHAQPFLTTAQLARRWNVSRSTLARYRRNGVGPPWQRTPGGQIRYPIAGLPEHNDTPDPEQEK